MKKTTNTRKFRLQAKRRQNRRRQVRFNQNVQQLVAGGYPEREARPLVRHMNRLVSAQFPGESIYVIGVLPVGDQFVEESVMAPAMIVDSPAAVVATEQPSPVSDTDSLLESLAEMIPDSEQLPPPPAFIDVPSVLVLTPRSEAPPEIAPAFCGCQGGYRTATRQAIPAPKKLGFFGRVKRGVNDFVVNHSSRRGGRNYRGQ